jgi:hypothetical protein
MPTSSVQPEPESNSVLKNKNFSNQKLFQKFFCSLIKYVFLLTKIVLFSRCNQAHKLNFHFKKDPERSELLVLTAISFTRPAP